MPIPDGLEGLHRAINSYNELGYSIEFIDKSHSCVIARTIEGTYLFHDGRDERKISPMRLYDIFRVLHSDKFTSHNLTDEEMKLFEEFGEAVIDAGSSVGLELGLINQENSEIFNEVLIKFLTGGYRDEETQRKLLDIVNKISTTY